MIIGVDARSLTEPHPSGVGMYCFSLINACARLAPTDTFILFTSGYRRSSSQFLQSLATLPNVQVVHLAWPNKLFHSLALLNLAPKIDAVIKGCDVFLAPNLHFLPLHSTVPLVVTIHDLTFEMYNQFLSVRRKLWHKAVRPYRLLQRAKAIIAVSETTRRDILEHYALPADKVTTIHSAAPNSVDPQPLDGLPTQYCVALSTIEPRKNIAALVAAFTEFVQRSPDSITDLVVIGSGGWKSADTIRAMQQHPRIHYFGYVTEAQKTFALQHARGFIYPSIYEGFGFPPLEALRAHIPVVVSQSGALPEILGTTPYYVDPYSIEDMITAFVAIDNNNAWRDQLVARSKDQSIEYTWETTARDTLKVLHESI